MTPQEFKEVNKLRQIHHLKTWKIYFQEVWNENKLFEIRKNDRGFQQGDLLILQEFDFLRQILTGREILCLVKYIFNSNGDFGLEEGFCAMSIKIIDKY